MSTKPQRTCAEINAELELAKEEYKRGEALVNVPFHKTRVQAFCLLAIPVLYFGGKAILKLIFGEELSQFVTVLFTAFAILLPFAVYSAKRSSYMNLVGVGTALMTKNKAEIERLKAELAELEGKPAEITAGEATE